MPGVKILRPDLHSCKLPFINTIQLTAVFIKLVHPALILHPQENEQATGKPQGQAKNIDKGKNLIPFKVPESDQQIVFIHPGSIGVEQTNDGPFTG